MIKPKIFHSISGVNATRRRSLQFEHTMTYPRIHSCKTSQAVQEAKGKLHHHINATNIM